MTNQGSMPRWPLIVLALSLVAALALAVSLRGGRPDATRALRLYYSDAQAMYLVPVDASLAAPGEAPDQAFASALLARMGTSPDPALVPVVGPEVRLESAAYAAPGWTVKLRLGQGAGSAMERLLVGGVVSSLVASTPGAERVQLSLVGADGAPWESQHLDLSRPLTPADVANRLGDAGASGLAGTIWWRSQGTEALVPVRTPLTGKAGTPPADALTRLVAGPAAEGAAALTGVVPAGLAPAWKGLEGEVATVDLAGPVPAGAEGARFVTAVALTLTEFEGVKAVRFTVKGRPAEGMVGAFALEAPITRPDRVNPVAPDAWPSPAVTP